MSKVNELLEDLFVEMIRAGCDGAGFEKDIAGVEFTVRIDIKADLERHNSKLIQEYQEHEDLVAKEIHEREQEPRGYTENGEKVQEEDVMQTYYITRDNTHGLLIHVEQPIMTGNNWISQGYCYKLRNETSYLNWLNEIGKDMSEWKMSSSLFYQGVIKSSKNIIWS